MAAPLKPQTAASMLSRVVLQPIQRRPLNPSTAQSLLRRTITTTSTTTEPDESTMPLKLYYSLAHTAGPRTMDDFRDIAQRKRQQMGQQDVDDAFSSSQDSQLQRRSTFLPRLPPKTQPPTQPISLPAEPSIHPTLHTMLPLLRSQPPFYATAYIHAKPYLVTKGDTVRLPFVMHGVQPGDVLRLDRVGLLGSREYTLRAGGSTGGLESIVEEGGLQPSTATDPFTESETPDPNSANQKPTRKLPHTFLPPSLYTLRATVLGEETEPLRIKEKTKRRQRRVKTVRSKHRFTLLRISELEVHGVEALGGPVEEVGGVFGEGSTS